MVEIGRKAPVSPRRRRWNALAPTLLDLSRIGEPDGFVAATLGFLGVQHEWLRLPAEAWDEDSSRLRGALVAATGELAALLRAGAREPQADLARLALARGVVAAHVSQAHAAAVRDALKAADREREHLRQLEQRDRADARVLEDAAHVLRRRAIERRAEDDPRRVERAHGLEAIAHGLRAAADEHAHLITELYATTHAPEGERRKRPRGLLRDAVFDALPRLAQTEPAQLLGSFQALARALLGETGDDPAADAAALEAAQQRRRSGRS